MFIAPTAFSEIGAIFTPSRSIPESYYDIWRYSDAKDWELLTVNYSPYINKSVAVIHLKVKRDGVPIEVYTNSHLLTTISEGSFFGMNYLGLIISSIDQAYLDVRFDNFYVTPSECIGKTTSSSSESRGRNSTNPHIMFEEDPMKLHLYPARGLLKQY